MPDQEGRSVEITAAPYRLKSVFLDDLEVRTEAFVFPHPRTINMSFTVTEVDDVPLLRLTELKIEFADKSDNKVASVNTSFKVEFIATDGFDDDDYSNRDLNMVATRISYPYHRQLVSDLVTRMGLRPTFLPAVPDDLWQASDDSAEEISF